MPEINKGIWQTLKPYSLVRAGIYTVGHIGIASVCNYLLTGAPLDLAALDAIVEPLINGVWYYVLDYLWNKGE